MNIYFSLVTYKHSINDILPLLTSISSFSRLQSRYDLHLCIHENISHTSLLTPSTLATYLSIPIHYSSSFNVGFGAGNNINFSKVDHQDSLFVAVNPDVEFLNISLNPLFDFLRQNPSFVAISPLIKDSYGTIQYSAKSNPSFLSLLLGRFSFLRAIPLFKAYYSLHINSNLNYSASLIPCSYLSGCFIVFRSSAYEMIDGFDESFFLHLEDADISRRLTHLGTVAQVPFVSVVHRWARGSHKSLFQTICLIKSYFYYISKWGFKFL